MNAIQCLAASVLALIATDGLAHAQDSLGGRIYAFHSKAQSGCPALDWHLVTEGNGEMTGMISWNNMQDIARATGTYNLQAKTFKMTAKETGGQGRTATIDGTIRSDGWLVANISGQNVNCQKVILPWSITQPPGGGAGHG
jgi:hypothetical protein